MKTAEAKIRLSNMSDSALTTFANYVTTKIDIAQRIEDLQTSRILLDLAELVKAELRQRVKQREQTPVEIVKESKEKGAKEFAVEYFRTHFEVEDESKESKKGREIEDRFRIPEGAFMTIEELLASQKKKS